MAKVEILFGSPATERRINEVEEWACYRDVNIETANIQNFKAVTSPLFVPNKSGDTYFELLIAVYSGSDVRLPKLSISTHKERGFLFPKLIIHGLYAKDTETHRKLLIEDGWINAIGQGYEDDFEFEYLGFCRQGKAEPIGGELIYMLKNKPHIYHGGSFIEVSRKKTKGKNVV